MQMSSRAFASLAAVCLLCMLPQLASAALSSRVQSGLQYLYTFTEGQLNTAATTTADTTNGGVFGSLAVNPTVASWVPTSVGINFPQTGDPTKSRVSSTVNTATLINRLNASGTFTFEFWLTPDVRVQSQTMLWGLTSLGASSPYTTCDLFPDGGVRFEHVSGALQAWVVGSDLTCTSTSYSLPANVAQKFHVVLTYTGNRLHFFVNGNEEAFANMGAMNYRVWNSAAIMQLGLMNSFSSVQRGWKGTIYLHAAYNRALNQSEITQNFQAGIANSRPVGTTTAASVTRVLGGNITLAGSDADGNSNALKFFIVAPLPVKGQVFVFNQSFPARLQLITAAQLPRALTSLNTVFFKPDNVDFGPNYATLAYQAFDGISLSATATVAISVSYINQPPTATPSTQQTFTAVYSPLQLNGTSPDSSLGIVVNAAIITVRPSNGTLYQTADGVTPGAAITAVPTQVTHPQRIVLYRSIDLSPSQLNGQAIVLLDNFQFRVRDSNFTQSIAAATVSVQVLNMLQAPDSTYSGAENTLVNVTLPTVSRNGSAVTTWITGIQPSAAVGSLFTASKLLITSFPFQLPNGAKFIFYRPQQYDFGPSQARILFQARLGQSQSAVGTATMSIAFVNNRPVLTQDVPASGTILTVQVNAAASQLVHASLGLFDPDRATQDYTLTVSCTFGASITLNTSTIQYLTFDAGDGRSDPDMQCNGPQWAITYAIKDIIFHGEFVGSNRICTFKVNDNDPTNPLTGSVTVTAIVVQNDQTVSSSSVAPIYLYLAYIAVIGAPSCCCLLICCKCYHSYKERRGEHLSNSFCAHCSLGIFGEAKKVQRLRRNSVDGLDSAYGGSY